MTLLPWCDHFVLNDTKTEYGYAIHTCKCGDKRVSEAHDNWKFCPVCGARRPEQNDPHN